MTRRDPSRRWRGAWGTAALFVLCLALGFGFRFGVCLHETARLRQLTGSDFAPFQVESAIAYAQVRAFAAGRSQSAATTGTATVAGLNADAQLSSGMERTLGWGLALKRALTGSPEFAGNGVYEDNPDDAAWVRGLLAFFIAWLPGWIFLWLVWSGLPRKWALLGALFYLVMPAALARYTGQELLKGAFALPLVAAYLAFFTRGAAGQDRRWNWIATGLFAFAAAANWDMAQVVLGAWALAECVRVLAGGEAQRSRALLHLAGWIGLILAAVLLPYGRAHGSVASPAVLWIFPWAIWLNLQRRSVWRNWGAGLLLLLLWLAAASHSSFAGNYSHFSELIAAKLKFLNCKPDDPTQLTFAQRFLWTPELHSANLRIVMQFFPLAFVLAALLTLAGACRKSWREAARQAGWRWGAPAALSAAFFVVFLFLVRFHELASLFVAPWLAWAGYLWWRTTRRLGARILLGALLALAFAAELEMSLRPRYYPARAIRFDANAVKLARAAHLENQVVLADLELGSLLAGYAGCALVVQPKFELAEVRQAAREYVEKLYIGSETELAEFCERHRVRFLFFRVGATQEPLTPYSYRYMAAAKTIPPDAALWLLDCRPYDLRDFQLSSLPEGSDPQLRIFRYAPTADRELSFELADRALRVWRDGDEPEGRKLLRAACRLNPTSGELRKMWMMLTETPPPNALIPEAEADSSGSVQNSCEAR